METNRIEKKEVMVSVVMITYNHENFIEQAINSVLIQKCDFEVELIISNDYSTDSTDAVIQRVLSQHPKREQVKYINRLSNVGMQFNFSDSIEKAKGKYIALCEGDDFWIDSLKLQKQVNFLESTNDINLCFHQVNYIDMTNQYLKLPKYKFPANVSQALPYSAVLENWCINTCSIMFRKTFGLKTYLKGLAVGDQPLCYFVNLDKDFYYFADTMATYRITSSGFTETVQKKELKSAIEFPFLNTINELSNSRYDKIIKKRKLRTIVKDLNFMKTSGLFSLSSRLSLYLKYSSYFFNNKASIRVAVYSLFKYVL